MKLWEAPLSSSELADTAPNKVCNSVTYEHKVTKQLEQKLRENMLKNLCLCFYATVVP